MTHREFIHTIAEEILAEVGDSILFRAEGELCCEIHGQEFSCSSVEEFHELVEFFEGETFEV